MVPEIGTGWHYWRGNGLYRKAKGNRNTFDKLHHQLQWPGFSFASSAGQPKRSATYERQRSGQGGIAKFIEKGTSARFGSGRQGGGKDSDGGPENRNSDGLLAEFRQRGPV